MNFAEYKNRLHKQATLLFSFNDLIDQVQDLGAMFASTMVASAVLGGAGLGWVGAKVASKDAQDIDHVKKQYDAERLKADLGYLSGKVQTEYADWKRRTGGNAPTVQREYESGRSMRLL